MRAKLGLTTALSVGCAGLASASDIHRDVSAGKTEALMPIFAFETSGCAAYPVHDIRIVKAPDHGKAELIAQAVPVDKIIPHCKGKMIKPTFVVYRSNPAYRGEDSVSVTFRRPTNTGEMTETYLSYSIDITVK